MHFSACHPTHTVTCTLVRVTLQISMFRFIQSLAALCLCLTQTGILHAQQKATDAGNIPRRIDASVLDAGTQKAATVKLKVKLPPLVVLVSIDGLRYDALGSNTPTINALAREGTFAKGMMTIKNSSTLPSHASMFTGVPPEEHGIDFNAYRPERGIIRVHSIFQWAHQAGMPSAMFVAKNKFKHVVEPEAPENFVIAGTVCQRINERAMAYLYHTSQGLVFVHYGDTDRAGHLYSWMSMPYLSAVRQADTCLNSLVNYLKVRFAHTPLLLIVTSDHGGAGRRHGADSESNRHIPWVAWGSLAQRGVKIERPLITYDTASTILSALGLKQPDYMKGKAISEALKLAQ